MRWTSRLRRFGGLAKITEARGRQLQALNRAILKRIDLKSSAETNRDWLLRNELRCLSADEETFWSEAT